jgi:hypothetical protein
MALFTATEKLERFFFNTRGFRCVTRGAHFAQLYLSKKTF